MKPIINVLQPNLLSRTLNQQNQPIIDNIDEIYQQSLGLVKCTMGIVNAVAYYAMGNAIDKIKATPMWKGECKKILKGAINAHTEYERALCHGTFNGHDYFQPERFTEVMRANGNKPVTKRQLFEWWMDIGAFAYSHSSKQVEMFRIQIWNSLTTHQVPFREEISYYLLANTLLEYAVKIYHTLMSELKSKTNIDYTEIFREFCLAKVYKQFKRASIFMAKNVDPEKVIDLNHSENIRIAFRAFENAIMTDIRTGASANEALMENKDLLSKRALREYMINYNQGLEDYNNKHRTIL